MLRGLLLLLAGALVGANVVYFLMARTPECPPEVPADAHARATTVQAPMAGGTVEGSAVTGTREPRPLEPPAPSDPSPPASRATPPVAGHSLLIPVQGIEASDLLDTFDDRRGSDRIHEALDIMAPAGTPVLAATDGTIEKLFDSDNGGLTIYQFDLDRTHSYYYAHLQRYAPGLREGDQVQRGQVIGYVGSTGNASADAPHLHFGIHALGPEKSWWKGTPVNPYPLLRAGETRHR